MNQRDFRNPKIQINQTQYITFSTLLGLDLNSFIDVEIARRIPQLLKMALMEQNKITAGENTEETETSSFFLSFSSPNYGYKFVSLTVWISSSCMHFDVGSCPCYSYRSLTQWDKTFPDPAKGDERI